MSERRELPQLIDAKYFYRTLKEMLRAGGTPENYRNFLNK